jgi:hypothetical protein
LNKQNNTDDYKGNQPKSGKKKKKKKKKKGERMGKDLPESQGNLRGK